MPPPTGGHVSFLSVPRCARSDTPGLYSIINPHALGAGAAAYTGGGGLMRAQAPLDSIPIQFFLKYGAGLTMPIRPLPGSKMPGPGSSPSSPPWLWGPFTAIPILLFLPTSHLLPRHLCSVPSPSTTFAPGICPWCGRPLLPFLTSLKNQLRCGPPLRRVVPTSKADTGRTTAPLRAKRRLQFGFGENGAPWCSGS